MLIIASIVAAVVIAGFAIFFFLANGSRRRGESLGRDRKTPPRAPKEKDRAAGID
jgi:hypothetical protein